jgi:hypothetical protein
LIVVVPSAARLELRWLFSSLCNFRCAGYSIEEPLQVVGIRKPAAALGFVG